MKVLLLALISLPLYSNTFQLEDSGSRFFLKITKESLIYKSEVFAQEVPLNDCSLEYAKTINSDLLASLSNSVTEKGLTFKVDDETYKVGGELAKKILLMDGRILSFMTTASEVCQ